MPDEQIKRRIFRYRMQVAACQLLLEVKRERFRRASQWAQIHQSELWSRRLQEQVDKLDQARDDVIVVAITGIASVAAAYAVTAQLARAGGYVYRAARLGVVAERVREITTVGGQTVRVLSVPAFSLRAWALAKLRTLPLSVIGAGVASATGGGTVFGLLTRMYRECTEAPLSGEELDQLRQTLLEAGVGDPDFQAVAGNPRSSAAQLQEAVRGLVDETIAQNISEEIQGLPQPLPGYLLMSEGELARWYRKFRRDSQEVFQRADLDCSDEQRVILRQIALLDFWLDIMRSLDEFERRLKRDIGILEEAIKDEESTLRFNELQRGIQRASLQAR